MTTQKDPLIIECAWEVCNQVGGIYTVIRSKVPAAVDTFGQNYCLLGPLENENISAEFDPIHNLSDPIGRTVEKMRNMGLDVRYGHWLVTGRPRAVLLNPQNVFNRLDSLHRHLNTDFGINTHREDRSEEHTSELQSRPHLVCRLLLEKKKKENNTTDAHSENTANRHAPQTPPPPQDDRSGDRPGPAPVDRTRGDGDVDILRLPYTCRT